MPFETLLLGYAGLASIALGTIRFRRRVDGLRLPAVHVARLAGTALLLAAGLAAWRSFGPAQGVVAWIGMVSAAGAMFVLVTSRWPRFGLALAVVAALLALVLR